MKRAYTFLLLLALLAPFQVFAAVSLHTDRLQASFEDNGNWVLTDNLIQTTWHGEWLSDGLMRVTGSDGTCFVVGENEHGMVQFDCQNLKEISILVSYQDSV